MKSKNTYSLFKFDILNLAIMCFYASRGLRSEAISMQTKFLYTDYRQSYRLNHIVYFTQYIVHAYTVLKFSMWSSFVWSAPVFFFCLLTLFVSFLANFWIWLLCQVVFLKRHRPPFGAYSIRKHNQCNARRKALNADLSIYKQRRIFTELTYGADITQCF